MKPENINILGVIYKVKYCDSPSDVDIHKRESLWGQIDYWDRTIRIYDNGRPAGDILQVILHEVIHGIDEALHLKLGKENDMEEVVDLLAMALADILVRNEWLKSDFEGKE